MRSLPAKTPDCVSLAQSRVCVIFAAANVNTPVAFIIFRRPDLTARVFERIRAARPARLFIIADGPRTPHEAIECEHARRIVECVDWPCEVKRDYSDRNMGCRDRIATGLDWVFAEVPEAIVLEDDCLPAQSFFGFCEELLEHYRQSDRVMHISGSNFLVQHATPYSYYHSRYAHMWGWATWARAWRHMDLNLRNWPTFKNSSLGQLFSDKDERNYWIQKLHPFFIGERTDTWDHPWQYSIWAQRGVCVVPQTNLVANIGFGDDATHTQNKNSPISNLPIGEMPPVLQHPPGVSLDDEADRAVYLQVFGGQRTKLRKSWRYKLSKPARIYRKLRERWSGRRSVTTPSS